MLHVSNVRKQCYSHKHISAFLADALTEIIFILTAIHVCIMRYFRMRMWIGNIMYFFFWFTSLAFYSNKAFLRHSDFVLLENISWPSIRIFFSFDCFAIKLRKWFTITLYTIGGVAISGIATFFLFLSFFLVGKNGQRDIRYWLYV